MKQAKKLHCPNCGAEYFEGSAKVCAGCGVKLPKKKKKTLLIVLAVIVVLGIIGAAGGSGDDEDTSGAPDGSTNGDVVEEVINYTPCTTDELAEELEGNALRAEETYQGQYVELTGRLDVIDSDGKYIALYPIHDEWSLTGVRCYIMNDEQKAQVVNMNEGNTVTVRGKIISVGEVIGYDLDIDEIVG